MKFLKDGRRFPNSLSLYFNMKNQLTQLAQTADSSLLRFIDMEKDKPRFANYLTGLKILDKNMEIARESN